jgi:two-component system response regulator HydG
MRMESVTPEDGATHESTEVYGEVREPTATAASFLVTVTEGPESGSSFLLDGSQPSRVLLGQGPACFFRLSDKLVSRRHASLDVHGGWLRVTDLGSTNGTHVNGVRVTGAELRGGEVLRIGGTSLRVDLAAPEAALPLPSDLRFGRLIGGSPAMRRLFPLFERLASTDLPLIIEGETGTGKELLAESLHEASPRASGPFVVFDCTAVSPNLVESSLFGHEKGAFTGATSTRRGVFEQAEGGTLLIDELGELDLTLQSKLLRAIERSVVQRVGGERWITVNVRVIAATRRDLDAEVQAKRFRDDLFFRLAVARAELPPLRDREGDVGLLARHFWRELGASGTPFPPGLLDRFEEYSWPGNVRELHNAVMRRIALGELVAPGSEAATRSAGAPDRVFEEVLAQDLPLPRARQRVVEEFERVYVARVLERFGGNVSRAAAASGIARRYFHLLVARHR